MKNQLHIGQKVRHPSTREVGVVVWLWESNEYGDVDAYIAFFGSQFPTGIPNEKPYVLRYYESSLEVLTE
jgi:hypothetical protein